MPGVHEKQKVLDKWMEEGRIFFMEGRHGRGLLIDVFISPFH